MVSLLNFVSLLVLVNSACFVDLQLAQKESPIINVKLDKRKKILTWNSRRNMTQQECIIDIPLEDPIRPAVEVSDDDTYTCTFVSHLVHRGANLTVNVTADGQVYQEFLTIPNPGKEGSGGTNLSCLIYNIRFMNCSWMPGPAAPADVSYHLYMWASLHGNVSECSWYILDSTGTRVGCHFENLDEPHNTDNYFFLLNGTSNETAIKFLDSIPFVGKDIEKYNPPANVSVTYNGSYYIVRWDNPKIRFHLSHHILCYEVDVQRKGSVSKGEPVFQRGEDENKYLLPGATVTGEHALRVRVKHAYGTIWSDWSATCSFGFPEKDFRGFLVILVGLLVGAVALFSMGLMFLCKRFSLKQKLFPPIPQVKQDLASSFMSNLETAWDRGHPAPGSQDPEDILTVEETRCFAR
ncbi:granulocyte-macrophage colony-stimulating factor receptor subunit alpha-like [Phacochoerus africanus]|uniref:granulocyte-macrophage colony-stimulating factor receptor subunit alpha-like n=1 Tax=Phacochoerus africanus TaxID=41426 RepID=UPI001FD93ED9|nr:granulocyte-macrophage colony-stimulating factor receptor subunit alpha-like [Phacochoerus africanus]